MQFGRCASTRADEIWHASYSRLCVAVGPLKVGIVSRGGGKAPVVNNCRRGDAVLSLSSWFKRRSLLLLVIFLLALALRLYAVIRFPAVPIADAADYHGLAVRLAEGHGYVSADGTPT